MMFKTRVMISITVLICMLSIVSLPLILSSETLAQDLFDAYKREAWSNEISSLENECVTSSISAARCHAMKECVLDSMMSTNKRYAALFVLMGNSVLIDSVNRKKIVSFSIKTFDPRRREYRKIYNRWKRTVDSSVGDMDKEAGEYVLFVNNCARENGFEISDKFIFIPENTQQLQTAR
ncbi:MAG: hypothetical protein FWD68_21290 [Alphaproteobacteria bacterium]|nr:hypothetical protein [Alphaproteobacteria bacterium]